MTTYYVDYSGGLDSNNGTTELTPWKTIAKVNSFGKNTGFSAGSSILFKCGKIWRESLYTFDPSGGKTSSGTISNPIRIGCYDSTSLGLPIICGSAWIPENK